MLLPPVHPLVGTWEPACGCSLPAPKKRNTQTRQDSTVDPKYTSQRRRKKAGMAPGRTGQDKTDRTVVNDNGSQGGKLRSVCLSMYLSLSVSAWAVSRERAVAGNVWACIHAPISSLGAESRVGASKKPMMDGVWATSSQAWPLAPGGGRWKKRCRWLPRCSCCCLRDGSIWPSRLCD